MAERVGGPGRATRSAAPRRPRTPRVAEPRRQEPSGGLPTTIDELIAPPTGTERDRRQRLTHVLADAPRDSGWQNKLYFGDNLAVLRQHIADESVDLIYIDPPFNSNATYNVLFKERSGARSVAQIAVFEDTWQWGEEAERTYHEIVTNPRLPNRLVELMKLLHSLFGRSDMLAYLTMMAPRLAELHRVLRRTGSFYLHCDPTASHYLRLLLDVIFGPQNFRSEIVWKRSSAHSDTKQGRKIHGHIHDTILFYTKSDTWTWNPVYTPYDEEYIDAFYRHVEPETGRRFRLSDLTAAKPGGDTSYLWRGVPPYKGRYWAYSKAKMEEFERQGRLYYTKSGMPNYKRYLDEMPGVPLQDVWTDVPPISPSAAERLGYPTQKPETLLERIIAASSNPGDVVLDAFCGCGTSVTVAQRLERRWIGIDITHLAITLIRHRLADTFGETALRNCEIIGDPKDVESALALAEHDRFQFEWWALGLIGARPAHGRRKGADSGIDGYLHFVDDSSNVPKTIIIQVKSGSVSVRDVRDLRGAMEREKATIGLLLTLQSPSEPMRREALSAGFYEPDAAPGERFQRLQILTIDDLLRGVRPSYPRFAPNITFAKAPRHRPKAQQEELPL